MSFSETKSFFDDYVKEHSDANLNKKANKWSTEIASQDMAKILDTKKENEDWRDEWNRGGKPYKIKALSGKVLFQAAMLRDYRNQYAVNVDGKEGGDNGPRSQESMARHLAEDLLFLKYVFNAWKETTE